MTEKTATKWSHAYEKLKAEIERGDYKKGDPFLSTSEVCEKFGFSYLTGRKVLSELARDKLIHTRPKTRSVVKSTLGEIYVFLPDFIKERGAGMSGGFVFAAMLKGIIGEAQNQGLNVEYINERTFRDVAKGNYLLVSQGHMQEMEDMLSDDLNMIILHASRAFPHYHTVRHGLYEGGYMATEYLIKKGYKSVAFISGPLKDIPWYLPRFEGYFDALKDNGVAFDLNYVKETSAAGKNRKREKNEDVEAFRSLMELSNAPDAVFCANDDRALNILDYCCKKGIGVPGEMAICGLDNRYESALSSPPLTTIDTHLEKVGHEGAKLAIKAEDGELEEVQDILVKPEIVKRKTT